MTRSSALSSWAIFDLSLVWQPLTSVDLSELSISGLKQTPLSRPMLKPFLIIAVVRSTVR